MTRVRSKRPLSSWRVLSILSLTILISLIGLSYSYFGLEDGWQGISWDQPQLLFAALVLPFVLWRGTVGEDRRNPRIMIGTVAPLLRSPGGLRLKFRDWPGILRTVGLGLLIVSLARPISTIYPDTSEEEGIDVVLVLDLSGSMAAVIDKFPEDLRRLLPPKAPGLRPTRLDAAKAVILDFIGRRKSDRIGVVVFGKAAYVLSPPTLDYQLLSTLVSKMELDLIDGSSTVIGDALGVAVARLRKGTAKSRAIILLTDGDNKGGGIAPEYAAKLATVVGAKVFPIQIGDGDTAELQQGFDLFGNPRYAQVDFPVNPTLLEKIAYMTSGQMYVANDAEALRASLHDVLDQLEKTSFEATVSSFLDLYRFFLLPGVLLIALDAILRTLVFRRFP